MTDTDIDTDSAPAFHQFTTDDHAAWVVATSYIFIILSIATVAAKILYQFHLRGLKLYDGLVLIATVRLRPSIIMPFFSVHAFVSFRFFRKLVSSSYSQFLALTETVCIISACRYSLGRHRDDLDDASFELYRKVSHRVLFWSRWLIVFRIYLITNSSSIQPKFSS